MADDIVALLLLFQGRVPDSDTHGKVLELAKNRSHWNGARNLFDVVRRRNLAAIASKHFAKECQYCFEEVCLKSLYNETQPEAPYDSDSPHWISKNALDLARVIGLSVQSVAEILSPSSRLPNAPKT